MGCYIVIYTGDLRSPESSGPEDAGGAPPRNLAKSQIISRGSYFGQPRINPQVCNGHGVVPGCSELQTV